MHIYIHINEWDWWNSGGNFEIKVRNVIVRLLRMLSKCKHADQRSGFFFEYDRSRAWKSNLCPCNKKKSWAIRVLTHTFETVRDIRLQNKLLQSAGKGVLKSHSKKYWTSSGAVGSINWKFGLDSELGCC